MNREWEITLWRGRLPTEQVQQCCNLNRMMNNQRFVNVLLNIQIYKIVCSPLGFLGTLPLVLMEITGGSKMSSLNDCSLSKL